MSKKQISRVGDPSTNKQSFTDVNLKIQCCRYWKIDVWDCDDLAFPFWRIYWNKSDGGVLSQNQKKHIMETNSVYVIPPFTSYSSKYEKNHSSEKGIKVLGRYINEFDDESILSKNSLLHLFIHFNLGIPFDNVYPKIYKISITPELQTKLDYLTDRLKKENKTFFVTYTLRLKSLISEVLAYLGPELFKTLNVDYRVLDVVRYIENNIHKNPKNSDLANIASMATNSFSRLFRQEMNMTLHSFIMKRKIAQACELFTLTTKSIEEIAFSTGFSDRYHFSRVFKSVTGLTPGQYKSGSFS